MAQYVPLVEWTDESLLLRKFIFDFWADTGRAPNLRQMHEGTQLSRRSIVQALKLLQTGIVVVVDQDSPNCDILKAPPYSAFPSQVEMYLDVVGPDNPRQGSSDEARRTLTSVLRPVRTLAEREGLVFVEGMKPR